MASSTFGSTKRVNKTSFMIEVSLWPPAGEEGAWPGSWIFLKHESLWVLKCSLSKIYIYIRAYENGEKSERTESNTSPRQSGTVEYFSALLKRPAAKWFPDSHVGLFRTIFYCCSVHIFMRGYDKIALSFFFIVRASLENSRVRVTKHRAPTRSDRFLGHPTDDQDSVCFYSRSFIASRVLNFSQFTIAKCVAEINAAIS